MNQLKNLIVFVLAFLMMSFAFSQIKSIHTIHGLVFLRGELFAKNEQTLLSSDGQALIPKKMSFINQVLANRLFGDFRYSDIIYAFMFVLLVISFGVSADALAKVRKDYKEI